MILNILITSFLVFLNGFFVAAEFSLVKVRSSQIELRVRTGSRFAKFAKHLLNHLNAYLSACQLGITLASLGLGWIGESVVAEIIKNIIAFLGISLSPELIHKIALPAAFITITFLHIIFGEQVPKLLAIQRSEQIALAVALPLRIFYIIFSPFIWLLNTMANGVIKLFGLEPTSVEYELHSAEEIRYILEESSKSGVIDTTEHELLENVFEFTDTPVKQVMVPRGKICGVEISMGTSDIMEKFIDEGYSRMPVYEKTIDNIVGIIYAKDIISLQMLKELVIMLDIIRPAYFVHEDRKINILLRMMQKEKVHLAIVLDEFGGTAGLVTLEDIIEEIFGEIQDEYDEEQPLIEQINENTYTVSAFAAIDDANDILPEPLPEDEDYETIGGLITSRVGRIPEENEEIELFNYLCTIVKRSERNLELVKLTYMKEEEKGEN